MEGSCSICGAGFEGNNCKQSGKEVARQRLAKKPKCRMRVKPWHTTA